MNRLHRISVLAALVAVSATSLLAQDDDAMITAAAALDQSFVDAVNGGDVDKLSDLYWNSPDLVSFPPGELVGRGYEYAVGSMKAFLGSTPGVKLELHDAVHMVAGEYVVTYGFFTMGIPTSDGGMQELKGRFTDVKAERDGRWVYVHDHASVPLPPPPPNVE